MIAGILFGIGLGALLAACFIRMRIFYPLKLDHTASPLLEGTFVTTFSDFLWISLYRARDRIGQEFRPKIVAYFWLTSSTVVLWVAAGSAYWLTDRVRVDAETADFLSIFRCPIASGTYKPAKIADLIAHPELRDGKGVNISGYFTNSFEHVAIYPARQDPFSATFSEGLWMLLSTDHKISNGQRITVRGVYTTKIRGHLGQWPGSICVNSVIAEN